MNLYVLQYPSISFLPSIIVSRALVAATVEPAAVEPSPPTSSPEPTSTKSSPKSPSGRSVVRTSVARQRYVLLHLATKASSSKLPAFREPGIQVDLQVLAVQTCSFQIFHGIEGPAFLLIDHEAEPTGGEPMSVEPHDDSVYTAALQKEFVDLFLGGEVREVSHIDGFGMH